MPYKEKFDAAIQFTRSLGFEVAELPNQSGELVSAEAGARVMRVLTGAGIRDIGASAQQCLKWTHALQPFVEQGLGCPVMLTIGTISIDDRPIFDPIHADFARWATEGISAKDFATRSGFNFHAWYTLPTMEVLDFTLWSTLAVAWKKPEMRANVVGGWPDRIAPSPTMTPIVVGAEYAERVHAISEVPLLSRDTSFEALSELPLLLMKL